MVGAAIDQLRWLAGTISVRQEPRGHFDCTTQRYAGSPPAGVSETFVRLPSCWSVAAGAAGGLSSSHGIAGTSAGRAYASRIILLVIVSRRACVRACIMLIESRRAWATVSEIVRSAPFGIRLRMLKCTWPCAPGCARVT